MTNTTFEQFFGLVATYKAKKAKSMLVRYSNPHCYTNHLYFFESEEGLIQKMLLQRIKTNELFT